MVDIAKVESDGIYHRLEVTFDTAEVAACRHEVLAKLAKDVQLPGFRPGKAPANLVARRYEKQTRQDLLVALRQRTIDEVLENSGMQVFALESIGVPDYVENLPLKFVVILDEKPQFELPDYRQIVLPELNKTLDEGEVQKAHDAILKQKSSFNAVDRAAKKGDSVKIAYEGRGSDGISLLEKHPDLRVWAEQKGTWEEAGVPNEFGISAIVEGVVGMKKGDRKIIPVAFPADFKVSALAGKNISYDCEVMEVRERVLPVMDEAFWKELGAENDSQFREKIRQYLEQNQEQEGKLRQREAIVAFLQANTKFPTPRGALNQEIDYVLRHMMQANLNRGVAQKELEEHRQELVAVAEKNAKEKIRMALIVDAIAAKENIQLKESDLNQLIFQEAMLNRCEPREIVAKLQNDRHAINDLRQRGLAIKTIDYILHLLTHSADCQCNACGQESGKVPTDQSDATVPSSAGDENRAEDADLSGEKSSAKANRKTISGVKRIKE